MKNSRTALSATAAFCVILSSTLSAQGAYIHLGPGNATSVSGDGTVVVGTPAYRWTAATGKVPLPGATSGQLQLSLDGVTASYDSLSPNQAGIWTQATGWNTIGFLPLALSCPSKSDAYDISADGSVVVGLSWEGCSGRAFKWDAVGGMVDLGRLGTRSARASAVSGDGSTVGGWEQDPATGSRRAAVWFPGGQEVLIIPQSAANPNGWGEVWGLNHDGSVIVGADEGNDEPFRWTASGGYELLGKLPGTSQFPGAYATNDDGSRIVGGIGSAFGNPVAFIWTAEDGIQRFDVFLERQGINAGQGRPFAWAFDITPDGKFIVGQRGINFIVGIDGFLVRLPEGVKYGIGAATANVLDLAGSGSDQLGGTLTVTTSNATAASVVTVVSSAAAKLPFAGGMVLIDPTVPTIVLTQGVVAGTASAAIPIPNQPALAGVSIYMQSIAGDPSQPGLIALSNGLKTILRQ